MKQQLSPAIRAAIQAYPWIEDHLKAFDKQAVFLNDFTYGEMHVYPGVLVAGGVHDEVTLHEHDFPHMMILYPGASDGPVSYGLFAIRSNGEEVERTVHPMGFAYIEAGIKHRLKLKSGRFGMYACAFATHGPDGSVRVEPKQWTGDQGPRAPHPFEAVCNV